jgi:MYXO-CTERM domain-containing protein
MAAGINTQLNPTLTEAGGIAPFISCNAQRNNLLAFVFANMTTDKQYLCSAIAHEAGHVYGLSHSLNALDPMTYMDLGSLKAWQNAEQVCGTETPQNCRCFPDTQNSFRYLKQTFGLNPELAEPSLSLETPREGFWVKPGFPIRAAFTSPLTTLSASMMIDGGTASTVTNNILAWNAPEAIGAGKHTVKVQGIDFADRMLEQTVNVNVMTSCAAGASCADNFYCLGGYCLPGGDVTGGLGATCVGNGDCSTNNCASDGTDSRCTATCDPGNTCPSGYDCIDGANVCWPGESGGCSVGGGSPTTLLAGFGAIVLALRRRRRS